VAKVVNSHPTPRVSKKPVFVEYPMRYFMDLVELGARSMDLVDLEFLKLRFLAEKNLSGAIFIICSALSPPNHAFRKNYG
jgi:hypothetical protein